MHLIKGNDIIVTKSLDSLQKFFEEQKATALALCDERRFEEAIAVYQQTPGLVAERFSTELPDTERAELLLLLGRAACDWANSPDSPIYGSYKQVQLFADAVKACRNALLVYTREDFPKEWGETQYILAKALGDQARWTSESTESARLLGEAAQACRNALLLRTREAFPEKWAETQNQLAKDLSAQAMSLWFSLDHEKQARLHGEAVQAWREALLFYTREDFPEKWAETQNDLAEALMNQAGAAKGAERIRLLGEAIACLEDTLKFLSEERFQTDSHQSQQRTRENLDRARHWIEKENKAPKTIDELYLSIYSPDIYWKDELLVFQPADSGPRLQPRFEFRGCKRMFPLFQKNQFEAVDELCEQAAATTARDTGALACRAVALMLQEKFADAFSVCEQALTITTSDEVLHRLAGDALSGLGRFEEALGHYDAALNLAPDYLFASHGKARVLEKLGPKSPGDFYALAEVCLDCDGWLWHKMASDFFDKALELLPADDRETLKIAKECFEKGFEARAHCARRYTEGEGKQWAEYFEECERKIAEKEEKYTSDGYLIIRHDEEAGEGWRKWEKRERESPSTGGNRNIIHTTSAKYRKEQYESEKKEFEEEQAEFEQRQRFRGRIAGLPETENTAPMLAYWYSEYARKEQGWGHAEDADFEARKTACRLRPRVAKYHHARLHLLTKERSFRYDIRSSGFSKESFDICNRLIESHPHWRWVLRKRCEVYHEVSEYLKKEHLGQTEATAKKGDEWMIKRVVEFSGSVENVFIEALESFDAFLHVCPCDSTVLWWRAALLENIGLNAWALENYNMALWMGRWGEYGYHAGMCASDRISVLRKMGYDTGDAKPLREKLTPIGGSPNAPKLYIVGGFKPPTREQLESQKQKMAKLDGLYAPKVREYFESRETPV